MSDNILYGLERSVYTRIARLALEEKGVPYVLHEVEIFGPEGVPPAHLQRHPFGRIPVLASGGFVLYETSAITRYVDEAFAGRLLQPHTPQQRARMNQVIGLLDAYGYRPMVWSVFVQRVRIPLQGGMPDEAEISRGLLDAGKCLQALDDLVALEPYLVGDMLSLADLHAYPMLRYLALAPEGRALLEDQHPRLWGWLEMMAQRPGVLRTRGRFEMGAEVAASSAQ
jgi:glutathione S-transferase